MRIGLIGHHVAPIAAPFAGGVEAMTWHLGRWLSRQGHDVILYAPPGSSVPGVTIRELPLHRTLTELARADVSMPPDRFMDAHMAYQQIMLELAADPDVDLIHSHSLHYLPLLMGALVPVPMLLTLHCPPTPWLESALRCGRTRRPHLTAVSHATADMWKASSRVDSVILNGIDPAHWRLGAGGPDLAWSGRIVPEKAPHLAIDVAQRAGRRLRIAGPILDRGYFQDQIAPRLSGAIKYVGHLSHIEMADFFADSAALLQTPVWEEPFGLTAAEAMSTGTPVISFARGGIPEVITEAGGVLIAVDDVPAMAAAIQRVERLPRAQVREHAVTTLGIDRMGLAYAELYRELLDGTPAGNDGDALGAVA